MVAQLAAGDFSKNRRTDLFGVCVNGKILRGVLCTKEGKIFWMNKPCHIHGQVNFDDDDGGDDKSVDFMYK